MPADTAADSMSWVGPIIQLVTAGGFGALVWFLIVKHIPSIEDRHKVERGEWLGYIEKRDNSYEQLAKEHTEAVNELKSELQMLRIRMEDNHAGRV